MKSFVEGDIELIRKSGLFDLDWYQQEYPDVKMLGMDPIEHYLWLGARLGRNPSSQFFSTFYLNKNSDVAKAGVNPLLHYVKHGRREGRAFSPLGTSIPIKQIEEAASPKPRIPTRKLLSWDWERENQFKRDISDIISANTGYFERISASVIMPTYNRADFIGRAIESVLAQTFSNWELIIVDDGSEDGTPDIISNYKKDKRIKFVQIAHSGVAAARNAGLEHSFGEYIFYLDSDNVWAPDFLRIMTVFMSIGRLGVSYCGLQAVGDDGTTKLYRGDEFDWVTCFNQNYIDMNCLGHRNMGMSKHIFDISLPRLVDWDYFLRITANERTAFAPFCGVTYYDGTRGRRITLTEAQGVEKYEQLHRRVQGKHQSDAFDAQQRPEIRPQYEQIILEHELNVLNDEHSRPILSLEPDMVDWATLRQREYRPNFVSIIVLCFNNWSLTEDCIRSIIKHTKPSKYDFEIIAVDNGSTDKTSSALSDLSSIHSCLKIVSPPKNLMFSLGNNYGIAHADGEFSIILNNDIIVELEWLDPLIDTLRLDQSVGAVGPKLLYPDKTLQCGGLVFNKKSRVPYHIYREFSSETPAVNKSRIFQALTGACLAFRTFDLVRLQGFDPLFLNGCEDLDICFRMRSLLRKRALYNPHSKIVHLESKSEGRGKFILRNRNKFVARWREHIQPDDFTYYAEDNYTARAYTKPGREPDGEAAIYIPTLERTEAGPLENLQMSKFSDQPYNIGFSTIWHARGISFHTKQIADSLEEDKKFRTHIFARWEAHQFSNDGPIHHPRVMNAGDDPSEDDISNWIKTNNINLMIFMEVHPKDWKRVRVAKSLGIPIICYENLDVMRYENIRNYDLFDAFLFNCFHTKDIVLSFFPQKRALMIPWGSTPTQTASKLIDQGRRSIDFVHVAGWGGINNRKNTDLLIRAFHKANLSSASLHVYTQAILKEYGEEISSICENTKNIIVHQGTVDNIHEAYQNKDMLLWPSKREGLGLPILEALSHGLPVLISNGYMMKQWIIPGEHGVLCPGKPKPGRMLLPELQVDQNDLVNAIIALANSPNRIQYMKQRVREDRWHWIWQWQSATLREQIKQFVEVPNYRPCADLSYLPSNILEFEYKRRLADQHALG